nr:hypothetical protein [Tanacetum cinerariifolium]
MGEHNIDFHPMVDFIEASPLRIETTEEGTQILATVDGSLNHLLGEILSLNMRKESAVYPRARIAQSSALPTVADEPASPQRDVSQREACPTDSGFIANQDRATIDKSSTLPYDSAPRVTSPIVDEGSMQQIILELTALCTSLQRQLSELTAKFQAQEVEISRLKERVKMLKDIEGVAATRSGDDAPIKGRTTILASGVVDVPTGSGSIPTASTPAEEQVPTGSDVVLTASPIFAIVVTPYRRRKGKEVMVELRTPKKQKVQEQINAQVARELEEQMEREDQRRSAQIARDAEIARIYAEEELQIMIDGLDRNNETVDKYLQEYHQFALELHMERNIELTTDLVKYQDNYAKIYKYQSQQRKPMLKKQKRDYYMAVIRNNLGWKMEDFIPMGSKEESERIKRKGLSLEQESAKKQKTSKEVPEEAMSPKEVPKEKSYWKITRLGGSSASYQFFIDLLKHLDREDLNQLWRLVKETLSNRPPSSDKEMELWVELSRNLHASGEGLPYKEGSSTYDDQLQTLIGELLTDGERFDLEDIQDCKLSKTSRVLITLEDPIINSFQQQFSSAIRINIGYGERAGPAGLEFSRKDLKAGIEEQDLITNIKNVVPDL